jgi:hypothetical protein
MNIVPIAALYGVATLLVSFAWPQYVTHKNTKRGDCFYIATLASLATVFFGTIWIALTESSIELEIILGVISVTLLFVIIVVIYYRLRDFWTDWHQKELDRLKKCIEKSFYESKNFNDPTFDASIVQTKPLSVLSRKGPQFAVCHGTAQSIQNTSIQAKSMTLPPGKHEIFVEIIQDENIAQVRFKDHIARAQQNKYDRSFDDPTTWFGVCHAKPLDDLVFMSVNPPDKFNKVLITGTNVYTEIKRSSQVIVVNYWTRLDNV